MLKDPRTRCCSVLSGLLASVKYPGLKTIKNILSFPVPLRSQVGIFDLVMSLKVVLPKKDYIDKVTK